MRELDFLFLYEHKVRELENLCLIKYELDRRGYRTDILYIEDAKNALAVKPFIHTKVLLVMACYDNHALNWQVKNFVKFDKVIDYRTRGNGFLTGTTDRLLQKQGRAVCPV